MLELKLSLKNAQIIGSIEDDDEKMALTKDLIRETERQIDKCEIADFAVGEMCRLSNRKLQYVDHIIAILKQAIESECADLLNHIGGYANLNTLNTKLSRTNKTVCVKTGFQECNKDKVYYTFFENVNFSNMCDILSLEECNDILNLIRLAVNQPRNIQTYGEYQYKN